MSILLHSVRQKQASNDTKYHCLYGYYFKGFSTSKLAEIYGKNRKTIKNWVNRYEETGSVGRKKDKDANFRKFNVKMRKWLVNLYLNEPTLFLDEAAKRFEAKYNERVSVSTVCRILREAKMTWKVLERRAIQVNYEDVSRFCAELLDFPWLLHNLVFLDECGFDNRDMLRSHGYGVKGQKLVYRGEFNRKPRVSILCFVGLDGVLDCCMSQGTFTRQRFLECLCDVATNNKNVFQHPGRNSVWIMDGAAIHCHPNVTHYLRSLGILPIFLPAYCPFFNPIEVLFGLMKKKFKRIHVENSVEDSKILVASIVSEFRNYCMRAIFRKCGYVQNGVFDPSRGLNQNLTHLGFDQDIGVESDEESME